MATTKIRIGKPLIDLTKDEAVLYRSIVRMMMEADNWHLIYSLEVAEAAQCFYRMQAAKDEAQKKGWVEDYEQGSNVTGYNTNFHKERATWEKHCTALGLTPAARDKIKSYKATEKKQPGIFARLNAIKTEAQKTKTG